MKNSITILLSICFLAGLVAGGDIAFAGADDLKARMKQRLPDILKLKAGGIIGENNRGYLEFVGGEKTGADVVAAENGDREKVYNAIARQQGTTAEKVGTRRAIQIAQKADPGEWLQNGNGTWYRK